MATWTEALDAVVERTGVARYRELCDSSRPDHEEWRAIIVNMASEPVAPVTTPIAYPPLHVQVKNALTAGLKFAASGFKLVSQEEYDRRLAICRAPCEFWDPTQERCTKCGCVDTWKAWLDSQKCPMDYWK
jgi:hypothetical protein